MSDYEPDMAAVVPLLEALKDRQLSKDEQLSALSMVWVSVANDEQLAALALPGHLELVQRRQLLYLTNMRKLVSAKPDLETANVHMSLHQAIQAKDWPAAEQLVAEIRKRLEEDVEKGGA